MFFSCVDSFPGFSFSFLFHCLVPPFFFACLSDLLKMLYFDLPLRCFFLSLCIPLLCIHIGRLYMLNPSQNIFLYPPSTVHRTIYPLPFFLSYHRTFVFLFYFILGISCINCFQHVVEFWLFFNFLFLALAFSFPGSFSSPLS